MGDGVVPVDIVSGVVSREFDVSTLAFTGDGLKFILRKRAKDERTSSSEGGLTYMRIGVCHIAVIAMVPELLHEDC